MVSATFISGNKKEQEWSLLTPLEWVVTGFDTRFLEGPERKTDSQIEELIEKNWENRQAERGRKGLFIEEPWPKTGYRGHDLDLAHRLMTVRISPADWKAMQGTHYNPEFYTLMLDRFNGRSRTKLPPENMHGDASFQAFIMPFLDGATAQCAAVETNAGYPVGLRSDEVGVAPGMWHVPGGYLPGVGQGIYKTEVPVVNGRPIIGRKVFTPDTASMADNARVNLFKESGSQINMAGAEVIYTGLIYEMPNHSVEFISIARTDLERFGTNWEHMRGKMFHYVLNDIPSLLNDPGALPGGVLNAAEAALAVAYLRKKGLDSIGEFRRISKS